MSKIKNIEIFNRPREKALKYGIDSLTDTTIKTIFNFNQKSTEIAFDVLVKDIRKSEEELNNGRDDK